MIDEPEELPYTPIVEGLGWARIYWVRGPIPAGRGRDRNEVKDPPNAGWSGAFVIDKGRKTVTLFSPYGFDAYNVSRASLEYKSIKADPYNPEFFEQMLPSRWAEISDRGWMKDFDTAAVVMRLLGLDVPMNTPSAKDGEEDKPRGGKEVGGQLLKPVKKSSRRGQVLEFFLGGEASRRSVREAMAEMEVSRKNLLSQLFLLQKDHGIGYTVTGDAVEVQLPEGCDDPFAA